MTQGSRPPAGSQVQLSAVRSGSGGRRSLSPQRSPGRSPRFANGDLDQPRRLVHKADMVTGDAGGDVPPVPGSLAQPASPRRGSGKLASGLTAGGARVSRFRLAAATLVAAGVQFGWALQLSLLTPYVQELGIPHAWASLIWLCGPISGLVVQPCVGVWSDTCTHRWGRRRPFILAGSLLVAAAVLTIAFSADLGALLGDDVSPTAGPRVRAIGVFVAGFWLLDLANNTVQGPVRALVADLSGSDSRDITAGNAFFSLWMAVGNILGYSTGAVGSWYRWFPVLESAACGEPCANLKAAFILAVTFLLLCVAVSFSCTREVPLKLGSSLHGGRAAADLRSERAALLAHGQGGSVGADLDQADAAGPGRPAGLASLLRNLTRGLRSMPGEMRVLMLLLALTWMAWFPFLLFDTDWMGREVYQGSPSGSAAAAALYRVGVREGALGLLLNSCVLGATSLVIAQACRRFGARQVWGISNIVMALAMACTGVITVAASRQIHIGPDDLPEYPHWVRAAAVAVFGVLGVPLAVTFSVPFAMAADLNSDSGAGQGLAMGILNLAIVVPQVVVSLSAGSWDALFGGGNEPAFLAAAVFALVAGVLALARLPNPCPSALHAMPVHAA